MANLTPETIKEVAAGESGRRVSYLFLDANRAPRNLTGYAAWITFAYVDADPHVERACLVDEMNGLAIYALQGDEFTQAGTVLAQFHIMTPNWYVNGAESRAYMEAPSPLLKFRVTRTPA